jgi:hypothetical protein
MFYTGTLVDMPFLVPRRCQKHTWKLMSATPQLAAKLAESTGVGDNWWCALELHLKVGLGARVRMHLYLFWLCVFSRRECEKDVVSHCEITGKLQIA